jgi:hypothetical protein
MTFHPAPRIKGQGTSQDGTRESRTNDWFQGIDELVKRFLDSNHIEGSMRVRVFLMKRHFPARQHMIGFKESLN